jgi:hypothetical protein
MPRVHLEYGIPNSEISAVAKPGQGRKIFQSRTFLSEFLASGQNCPIVAFANPARRIDKRGRFIAEIRSEARALGLSFRVDYRKGKGGHAMVCRRQTDHAAEPGN